MIYYQYPINLFNLLKKSKQRYIPRKIKPNESLKISHKYWLQDFESIVKVEEIFYIDNDIYYTIKDCSSGRYAAISISDNSTNYELFIDYDDIIDVPEIVYTDMCYSGAEIKAWFYYNGKDIYNGFYSYLDFYDDRHCINDTKNYFLYGTIEPGSNKYKDCRISFKKN